ncbi:MAG: heavy-metal-associated domain-containing protein [Bacteroidota bacterium]
MKKTIIALVACVLSLGAWAQTGKDSSTVKKDIETIKIKTSAVCDMCKETIEKALSYEKGVKESSLDVDSKILTVTYYTKRTSAERIRVAVTKAGYDADGKPADPKAYEHLDPCCKKDAKH